VISNYKDENGKNQSDPVEETLKTGKKKRGTAQRGRQYWTSFLMSNHWVPHSLYNQSRNFAGSMLTRSFKLASPKLYRPSAVWRRCCIVNHFASSLFRS